MTAGLPGVGIGGLFYLLSALLMPFIELGRTVRGRSSLERWRLVARQWLVAVGMIAALTAAVWALHHALTGPPPAPAGSGARPGTAEPALHRTGWSPMLAILLSWGLLALVLVGAYLAKVHGVVRQRKVTREPGPPLATRVPNALTTRA